MPGYSDRRAAPGDDLPDDPNPYDGIIRVYGGGRWMNWREWQDFSHREFTLKPEEPAPSQHKSQQKPTITQQQATFFE